MSGDKGREIVFATGNINKVREVQSLLGEDFKIMNLDDIGHLGDIPETGDTFKENALQKAQFVYDRYGFDCIAEDSGLEVDALGGAPGVYSARYAGPGKSDEANIEKLLDELKTQKNRAAHFSSCIVLLQGGRPYYFEGQVQGTIATEHAGNEGFGYDPVFIPEHADKTFAQMSRSEKSAISHRGKAVKKLIAFLKS